jgi:glyoxylase-like metal-dependent hydrolase (beta-lactamase superfamily II)
VTEGDLADLGVFRIPVPVPFPQAGGPVNLYLLEEEGGGVMMFDAGLGSEEGMAAIEEGFRRLGRRFDEVTRIVVSHGHVDHFGAARFVQERHGGTVPVFAHPADHAKMTEAGPRWKDLAPRYAAHLVGLGVPAEVLPAVAREGERAHGFSRRLAGAAAIGEGETVRTRHLALEVLHMPGHTPGLLCLHDRARRIVLSDDHLLEKVSPNPLIELRSEGGTGPDGGNGPDGGPRPGAGSGGFRPLLAYLASIERLRALDVELVLPGHGPPFGEHRAVIDRLLAFYERRQARVLDLLGAGPSTPYEVSRGLFPASRPGDVFLTVSEAIANLEVLEERGAAFREEGEVVRFRRAS